MGRPIVYCDESTFNNQTLKRKAWASQGKQITLFKSKTRFSVTVYAAISSNALTRPVFVLKRRTTNQEDFRDFIREVKGAIRADLAHVPYLLYDGHSAHGTPLTQAYVGQFFKPLPQPPYSCQFNSVERLFSLAKRNLCKLMAQEPTADSQEEFER